MIRKLHINESANYSDGVVNCTVSHLFEYDDEVFRDLVDWCDDYLSGYGLDAYVQTTRTYNNELSVFYDIEDLDTTTHEEVEDVITQAVEDFFDDEINENCLTESNKWSDWEEYTRKLYIDGNIQTMPTYLKKLSDGSAIGIDPDVVNDELVWSVHKTPEFGNAGFKLVATDFLSSGDAKDYVDLYLLDNDVDECVAAKTSYMNEKISEKDYTESKKGIAYKVFEFKNGKLYPPMVANAGNSATPTGVWLDAEPGEFVEIDGLQRVVQRGAKGDKLRQRIANLDNLDPEERKKEVKRIKGSTLAYRPGWHLGDEPRAAQFDREASWEILDELPEGVKISGNVTNEDTLAKKGTPGNIGKYFYIKSTGQYAHIIGGKGQVFFPYDFVWAECEYVADIDYQDEAMSYGYKKGKKFQHSLAGLPRVPEGGSYKYRTNPRPDTVPWVITGAIKVTKLLDDYNVKQILGGNAPERQGGDKTLSELGLKQI